MHALWSEGYFTDVSYTYGYYRELCPTLQRFCLLLRGVTPPQGDAPAHCELGFGQGVTVNVHAATTPGVYVGTDFNPQQTAYAADLAAAAGSGARLYDDSFAQLLARDDLPQFDSISLHGIWSWISPDNRDVIVEFARRHLKPGGVFYVSYNCLPGWAGAAPLRHLMAMYDRHAGDLRSAKDRVEDALGFASRLLAAKPRYAAAVNGLDERMKKLMTQDRQYLAHEYFNQHWNVGYFTDAVDALASAKLEFAASAQPVDTLDALHVSAEGQAFLATLDNAVMREQARDYFVNQQFRRDLFVRGARRMSAGERLAALMAQRFVMTVPAEQMSWKLMLAHGTAALNDAVYRPVVEVLAGQAYAVKSLAEITAAVAPRGVNANQALEAMIVLTGMGVAAPCQADADAAARRSSARALNEALLRQALHHDQVAVLASPVTGGGVTLDRSGKLFLLAKATKQADVAAFAWKALEAAGQRLRKGETILETAEENIAELRARLQTFDSQNLPLLKALQVL